jgi:hypothetical protein
MRGWVDENGSVVDVPIELLKRYGRGGKDGGRGREGRRVDRNEVTLCRLLRENDH